MPNTTVYRGSEDKARKMLKDRPPEFVRLHEPCHAWRHASAILAQDLRAAWAGIPAMVLDFRLQRSRIANPGPPRTAGGGAAGCPLLVFGITPRLLVEDDA